MFFINEYNIIRNNANRIINSFCPPPHVDKFLFKMFEQGFVLNVLYNLYICIKKPYPYSERGPIFRTRTYWADRNLFVHNQHINCHVRQNRFRRNLFALKMKKIIIKCKPYSIFS